MNGTPHRGLEASLVFGDDREALVLSREDYEGGKGIGRDESPNLSLYLWARLLSFREEEGVPGVAYLCRQGCPAPGELWW